MKAKTKGIISAALIIAMIFSLAALTACGSSESEETIKINIKIKGTTIDENQDLVVTAFPNELTVLTATKRECVEIIGVEFDYDIEIEAVKRIGPDISELFIGEYETEAPAETEDPDAAKEETEEETEEKAEDIVKDFYYDWVCTLNGVEATINDKIKDGDNIEWLWKEVKKEFVDKDRN